MHRASTGLAFNQHSMDHHPNLFDFFSVASQSVLMHGVDSSELCNFVLLVECQEISLSRAFPFLKIPLDSSSDIHHVNYSP